MKFVADLHIHSKYSRATSSSTDLENLNKWAKIKGVDVLGTGDFTHHLWLKEIKEKLRPAEPGLFTLKSALTKGNSNANDVRFMLTSEISCIYKKTNKVRKVHLIIFAPSVEVVEKINEKLSKIGNLKSDGRPILGLDAKELLKIVLDISSDCLVVPAHLWTPWFSIFGSKSGFDTIQECFDEYSKYIYAVETGLSSDPKMNWRLSQLDNVALISNSDAHSPQKIAREANVFDTELSYFDIVKAIKTKDSKKFLQTIEFFPEEGKYHLDGHRACNVKLEPKESKKYKNICPVCKKPLVIGVQNRVEELADRPEGFVLKNAIPFVSLIPLQEIIADSIGKTVLAKDVARFYNLLTTNLGSELKILLEANKQDIQENSLPQIAESIIKVRKGEVVLDPGYDGVYGKIKIALTFDNK